MDQNDKKVVCGAIYLEIKKIVSSQETTDEKADKLVELYSSAPLPYKVIVISAMIMIIAEINS